MRLSQLARDEVARACRALVLGRDVLVTLQCGFCLVDRGVQVALVEHRTLDPSSEPRHCDVAESSRVRWAHWYWDRSCSNHQTFCGLPKPARRALLIAVRASVRPTERRPLREKSLPSCPPKRTTNSSADTRQQARPKGRPDNWQSTPNQTISDEVCASRAPSFHSIYARFFRCPKAGSSPCPGGRQRRVGESGWLSRRGSFPPIQVFTLRLAMLAVEPSRDVGDNHIRTGALGSVPAIRSAAPLWSAMGIDLNQRRKAFATEVQRIVDEAS